MKFKKNETLAISSEQDYIQKPCLGKKKCFFFLGKKKSLSLAEWSWIQIINIKTWKGRIRSKLFGLRQAMDGRNSSAEHKI